MARTKDPEREQARRNDMVAATYRLLGTLSYEQLTLETVAKDLGVSKGMVQYYFASKEALVVATIEVFLQAHVALLRSIASQDKPVSERLADLVFAVLPSHALITERTRFVSEVWSVAKTSAAALHALHSTYAEFYAACRELVEVGAREGFVRVRDRAGLLVAVTALLDGLALQAVYTPDVDLEARRKLAVRTIAQLAGAAPPKARSKRRKQR